MKYLLWRSRVKAFIEENYPNVENWEALATWRDYFIENKSPALASAEAYERSISKA
tara:strand:+ start:234 stop:401 length:168 start_codon:yes stop_codon:yes gene_type:complete